MRYRVMDLPTVGMGAFTPTMGVPAASSSWGVVKRTALLGLVPIPTPSPESTWAPPTSKDRTTQPSNVAPDAILRDQYVAYADNMGPVADAGIGMATRRLCPLPVPAVAWIPSPQRAMMHPPIAGRSVGTAWPRAYQRFPVRGR